jgi:hypothetical protein
MLLTVRFVMKDARLGIATLVRMLDRDTKRACI